jgi:hypothetical protein
MPYTIQELTQVLGYSKDQIRVRLDRFAQPLQGHVRKGQFNRIEVDDSGLMILQRAKQLEVQHGDLRTVQSLLRVETETSNTETEETTDGNGTKHVSVDQTKLIETLEREIDHLQGEIDFLRARVEELTPLALPRPRRGLFAWLRRIPSRN